mgnify:CR=1 FL=1
MHLTKQPQGNPGKDMGKMTRNLRRLEATEAETLKAITDYLEILQKQGRILYVRHSPSNVIGKKGEATFRKPRASQLGAADLIVFRRKRIEITKFYFQDVTDVLCIEVKSPTGKVSLAQERWAQRAVAEGVRYIIARSIEDVIKAMERSN